MRLAQSLGLLFLLGVGGQSARAAESYDNCTGFIDSLPAVIGSQGVWCLRTDLSTSLSDGAAINVVVNNVTIDCNHFKLGGLAAGPATLTVGVQAEAVLNTVVRQCNIRGFYVGIRLDGGGGQLVEDNRVEGSTGVGIRVGDGNGTVRRNLVLDTGDGVAGQVIGIRSEGNNDILDNTVAEVSSPSSLGLAIGIYASPFTAHVTGNRVRGIHAPTGGESVAIYVAAAVSGHPIVSGNHLSSDDEGPFGIYCGDEGLPLPAQGIARDNLVAGFVDAVSGCTSSQNTVVEIP